MIKKLDEWIDISLLLCPVNSIIKLKHLKT